MTDTREPSPHLIELEQARLVDFVQTAAIGLHWVAADGTILWANPADYEPLGYRAEEYIGHNITEFHADGPVIEDILARLSNGERVEEYEARLRCKDGSTRIVRITSSALFDEEGSFVHTRCFTRDVTNERVAADRVRLLSEASDLLASSLDPEAMLSTLCRVCVPRIADWCAIELVGEDGSSQHRAAAHADVEKAERVRELPERFPREPDAQHGVSRVLRTGEAEHVEELPDERLGEVASGPEHEAVLRALGLRSYIVVPITLRDRVLGTITLVTTAPGRRYGDDDVEMAWGIATRAAQAIENARLYAEARESVRRKDEFLAMLGHELRNPLAPIRTALELMKLRGDEATAREQGVIDRQVRHLGRLVDDLLDVARVTRGKIHLEKAPVEVATIAAQAIEMSSALLEQREHDLSTDVPPTGLAVRGDPQRLAQVVANLLTNAAKYTPPGGRIELRGRRDGSSVVIEVRDDGVGISEDLLPEIFELFQQSPQRLDRAEGGLGVGLKLARSLVQLHGGEIAAHSDGPGKGSCFTVRLPGLALDTPEPRSRPQQESEHVDGRDGHAVLVVDDNEDAAAMLAEALRSAGHRVEAAHDGLDAVAVAERFRPDVALLDIGLPRMDGYELAAHLRETVGPSTRLFAMTGYGQEADRRRSQEAGFERHLVKPVALASLLEAVG